MLPFPHSVLLNAQYPQVRVTDVQSNTADLTVYTFSNCMVDHRSTDPAPTIAAVPRDGLWVRSRDRKGIIVIIHGEDDAITFTVTSVSIGGVNGASMVDRGGGTNPANTAMFRWPSEMLDGIANTNIVVTFAEAVTSCAIGVLTVSNLMQCNFLGSASGTGTGLITLQPTFSATNAPSGLAAIVGMTASLSGGAENSIISNSQSGGTFQPILLYEGSNAELGYAAYWAKYPCFNSNHGSGIGFGCDWSGAGTHDAAAVTLYG